MPTTAMDAPHLSAKMLKLIDQFLEAFYESGESQEAGRLMASSGMKKSQIRGLESLIVCTTRFSEIPNYIKNQAGKGRQEWLSVGPRLLTQLQTLETEAINIAAGDPAARLDIKLKLAKGWARQVVAHYLYETREDHQ